MYYSEKPADPEFGFLDTKEGQETEIMCFTSGGRPQPKIIFFYNETFKNFSNTASFDINNETFNVSSSYRGSFHRRDNHNNLHCCVIHDLFTGQQSCHSIRLDVKCMYRLV